MPKRKCVIVAGSSGYIGQSLIKHLISETEFVILGIDIAAESIKHERFIFFKGSVLDHNFLNKVSKWVKDSSSELVGIVTCIAKPEVNNSAQEYSDQLKEKFPEISERTLELLAAWSEYPQSESTAVFEINCLGANNVVSSQLENLLASKSASVIHVSSQYGIKTPRQQLFENPEKFSYKPFPYSISKSALLMLSEYQASLFAGTQVRVNAISPGAIMQNQSMEFQASYARQTWRNSMLRVEDIVKPICFLLSDGSNYMTGANLVVDGGWNRA